MKAQRKRRKFWLAMCCCLLVGCTPSPQAAQEAVAVSVSVERVTARDLPETLLLPGRVIPRVQSAVVTTAPGQVQSVLAQVGDFVKKGQLLATLNTSASQASLLEARQALIGLEQQIHRVQNAAFAPTYTGDGTASNLSVRPDPLKEEIAQLESQAQQQLAELLQGFQKPSSETLAHLLHIGRQLQESERQLSLLQTQTNLESALDMLRAPLLQTLQTQLLQARQAVRLAEAQLQAASLTAPFDGVILAQQAVANTPAAPGVALFQVGDVQQVDFELLVDSSVQAKLKPGQVTHVKIGDQHEVSTTLTSVSPALDLQAKSFTAHALLTNAQDTYKPGQVGQALVTLDPHRDVLTLRTAAILHDPHGAYVLRVQNGVAVTQRVEVGYNDGTHTEIRSGLAQDAEVISEGADRVHSGSKVNIVHAGKST